MTKGWTEGKAATPPAWPVALRPWVVVARAEPEQGLNVSRLPPATKRAKWDEIRRHQPELAALLKDSNFQSLIKAFDAEVFIDTEDASAP